MDYSYIAMDVMIIAALTLLLYMFYRGGILDRHKRIIFAHTVYVIILAVLSQIGTTIFDNSAPQFRYLSMFFNALAFALSPFIAVLFSFVFVEKNKTFKIIASIPATINAIIVILSPWFGFVFSVSENNRYSRGPLFFVYVSTYIIGYVLIALASCKLAKKYQFRAKMIVHLILLFLIVGTMVQVIFPEIHTTTICILIAILLYYALLCEQGDRFDIQTSLLNRRTFEQEILRFKKAPRGAYILFDVDNFKCVNDTYGHMFGDYCLTTLAEVIINRLEEYGYCFRIGGDEFSVLLTIDDDKKIEKLLKEIKRDVAKIREKDSRIPDMSMGCVSFRQSEAGDIDMEKIILEADRRMYDYKRANKVKIKS